MKLKPLTPEQMQWCNDNQIWLRVALTNTKEILTNVFNIYNSITGENKRVTSCGRCVDSVKKVVRQQYQKQLEQ